MSPCHLSGSHNYPAAGSADKSGKSGEGAEGALIDGWSICFAPRNIDEMRSSQYRVLLCEASQIAYSLVLAASVFRTRAMGQ